MKRMQAIALLFLALSTVGYAVLDASAPRAEAQAGSNLDGTYLRNAATAAAEDASRESAIAARTASLPRHIRDSWRAQLEELARPMPRVVLRRESSDLIVENGNRVELRSNASGAKEDLEGGWQIDQRIINGVLVQHIEGGRTLGGELRQTVRYSFGANDQTLTVESRIEGGELESAITFRTTYRRQ